MASSLKSRLKKTIVSLLTAKLIDVGISINIVYLFGSYASGTETSASDIDIAVLGNKKIPSLTRWQLQAELADALACDVDLVDLLSASTVMQNQIIHHGLCLYETKNSAVLFEMQVMSMYQHLNDERADILAQFIKG
ncbi:type VII toxin-antitoxin system MntA family adenylyltransferase antitoxin [Colwellia sp. TT2012]|uniref:type VII toxin-antitoxin system MntA family adenylyltransferase antitoxin n=1 Tax=Colwellia sp. TT2012 TaxID=1720342 RepID=UPI00070AD03A|nr:nucleotidyltransferase domain-containing protein [Colwellia sp. TT2012]